MVPLAVMRLHNFFIEHRIGSDLIGKELVLSDESLFHQLKNVFRFHEGDKLILLDNSGFRYGSTIVSLGKNSVTFLIEEQKNTDAKLPIRVVLFQSLIKKDKFEWVVEKATELGTEAFVPVLSERSEKKDLNRDRLKKIIKEASEQSGRANLPELYEITPFEEMFTRSEMFFLAFDPKGEPLKHEKIVNDAKDRQLAILVGPEGGWSESELMFMKEKKVVICSLGGQVLKAETAAISAAALFLLKS